VALHGGVAAALASWVGANALTAVVALAATRDLWLPPDVPPLDDKLTLAIARLAVVMGAVQVVNLFSYRTELFILNHYQGSTGVVYLSVRRGRPGLSLSVSVAGMVLTAGAAFLLVPSHGGSGAAVASSIGYAGGAVLTWWFFARLARARLAQLA